MCLTLVLAHRRITSQGNGQYHIAALVANYLLTAFFPVQRNVFSLLCQLFLALFCSDIVLFGYIAFHVGYIDPCYYETHVSVIIALL